MKLWIRPAHNGGVFWTLANRRPDVYANWHYASSVISAKFNARQEGATSLAYHGTGFKFGRVVRGLDNLTTRV